MAYKVLRSNTTGNVPSTTGAADYGQLAVNLADRKLFMRDGAGAAQLIASLIDDYSEALEYAVGDFAVESNVIWRCNTPVSTPEAFDDEKWDAMGASVGLDPAVLLEPLTSDRNVIQPGADVTALTVLPAGGQSASLVSINGTLHDARGLPIGRYGETVFLVSQTSHPFSAVGQPAAYIHPNWALADADDASTAVRAIVHEIIDANNVLLQMGGKVRNLSSSAVDGGSFVAGTTYYLSTNAGKLTGVAPANAQPVLLATSSSQGLLLLANAAGASIVSRTPNSSAQTVFTPFRMVSADGAKGFQFSPTAQSITSLSGTPIPLTFQEDGKLLVGGAFETSGPPTFRSGALISSGSPSLSIAETDQADPAGRWRFIGEGNVLKLRKVTSINFGTFDDILDLVTAAGGFRSRVPSQFDLAVTLLSTLGVADKIDSTALDEMLQLLTNTGSNAVFRRTAIGDEAIQLRLRFGGSGGTSGALVLSGGDTNWLSINPSQGRINSNLSLTMGSEVIAPSFSIYSNSNKVVTFATAAGDEKASILSLSADDSLLMRVRTSGVTRAGLRMFTDGRWSMTEGFWDGINFGSGTASNQTDLSRHVSLHGSGYGLTVTSNALNIVVPSSGARVFFRTGTSGAGTLDAIIENSGTSLPSAESVVTRQSGDNRYRNASNLDAGTVPVDRLPTSSSERSRILTLLAGVSDGAVGTYAFLSRESGNALTMGSSYAGSSLRRCVVVDEGSDTDVATGGTMSGTWMAMGGTTVDSGNRQATLFLRVA